MNQPGPNNAITDVPGIRVGHHQNESTGTTVILPADEGAVAGVDVRGFAPATRETAALDPTHLIERVHAIVLSGGSAFGLSTADGVMRALSAQHIGFPVGQGLVVPIVPAACLFDLRLGNNGIVQPDESFGRQALAQATSGRVPQGNVGAGTGATAATLKGGLGTASLVLDQDVVVGALVVVNAFGSAADPETGRLYAAPFGLQDEFAGLNPHPAAPSDPDSPGLLQNTTLAVVATNATLSKPQATNVAQMAHDGMARAIRPIHTMFDGDTVFALSTCQIEIDVQQDAPFPVREAIKTNLIGAAAADTLTRAIGQAMLHAASAFGSKSYRDSHLE